jgi:hypothetical protein
LYWCGAGERDSIIETRVPPGVASRHRRGLLADAEPAEDDAEQVVGGELARDRRERALRGT